MFVGSLAVIVVALIVVILRRDSRTENADGLLIEESARRQAHEDRVTYRYTNPVFDVAPRRSADGRR